MVFQPFSITVFALGCMLAFISALVFNLMPALEPGVSVRQVGRVAINNSDLFRSHRRFRDFSDLWLCPLPASKVIHR